MSSLPSVVEVSRFWDVIEEAWVRVGGVGDSTRRGLAGRDSDEVAFLVESHLDEFLARLQEISSGAEGSELAALDRVLERVLFDIDRRDIHEMTDGSDDGFLYCRGFIVAMGREFYEAVVADPSIAVMDAECERMCYFFAHLYNERFGEFPDTGSGISRESGSNSDRWR
ncbi:DUF4240 domain-containing protein [Nocardia panacis]|uniref:DUF4240 domain-containing protein n=1 Tax=Nocardia panacis TaxID=2340916 RepID=A0A3A4KL36_9NOCA|nr:DUF4240 domain-containing protein [Nocardia panacis]RJO77572.1 DUF4240 domain-containing protein [Nocardia panacis]